MRVRITRAGVLVLLVGLALVATGARCVENTSLRVDDNGYTHGYGEMYNDTEIQGHQLLLHGRLFATDGSIIAEHDAPLCPPDLGPHTSAMFDIIFDPQYLPPASSFDVHVRAGTTSAEALPDPKIAVTGASAKMGQGEAVLRIDVKNNSGTEYFNLNGCVAGYDSQGKMIAARSVALHNANDAGTPEPGKGLGPNPDYILLRLLNPAADVVALRGWTWLASNDTVPHQTYQPITTNVVPIAH